jgi:hypothetical protein
MKKQEDLKIGGLEMRFKAGDKVRFVTRPPDSGFSEDYHYEQGKIYTIREQSSSNNVRTIENGYWMDASAFRRESICKSECCEEGDRNCPFFQESE